MAEIARKGKIKINHSDNVARHYNLVQTRLSPLARNVFAMLRRNGTLTALDAQRSRLGINASSFTKRLSELREVGFVISGEDLRDDVTGRRYRKYRISGVKN